MNRQDVINELKAIQDTCNATAQRCGRVIAALERTAMAPMQPPPPEPDDEGFYAEPPEQFREEHTPLPKAPLCNCGEPAVLKTLNSKRTGKPYNVWTCARSRENQCDYWVFPDKQR